MMNEQIKKKREENIGLAMAAKDGDEEAIAKLYDNLYNLIKKVVYSYDYNKVIPKIDLPRLGRDAIIQACKNYDPEKGRNFAMYFRRHMINAVAQEIMSQTMTVRVPCEAYNKNRKYRRAVAELEEINGYPPSFKEIAEYINESEISVKRIIMAPVDIGRLDKENEDGQKPIDDISDTNAKMPSEEVEKKIMLEYIECLFEELLKPREIEMIKYKYIEDMSLEDIAKIFGISPQRVAQVIGHAIAIVKKRTREER